MRHLWAARNRALAIRRKNTNPEAAGTAVKAATMTSATWITMIAVTTFIWGGFAFALRTAVRKESGKGGDA